LGQTEPKSPGRYLYWRVEGSLLELTTIRSVAFFTWNSQTFTERWLRRGTALLMAVLRPFLYALHRGFATRVVYSILRGISRDRLDLLGEEYFQYKLKPRLKPDGVQRLKGLVESKGSDSRFCRVVSVAGAKDFCRLPEEIQILDSMPMEMPCLVQYTYMFTINGQA